MAQLPGALIARLLNQAPALLARAERVPVSNTYSLGGAARDTPELIKILAGKRKPAWKPVVGAFSTC
jgi:hypothetical protein